MMPRSLGGARGAVALALVLALARPAAADDKPELLRMRFFESPSKISVTTSLTKLFDSESYDKLEDGLPSTVVIRIWVSPADKTEPIAFTVIEREVYFEVWQEVYLMRISDARGTRHVQVKHKAEALKLLTSIDNLPIVDAKRLPIGKHFVVAMVAELNPVSRAMLAEVRRWLTENDHDTWVSDIIKAFTNPPVPEADRVLRIRSQPFYRPEPQSARR